jgi:VanZ family protein
MVAWAAVIFILSTKGFSFVWSQRLLGVPLRLFALSLPYPTLLHLDLVVRKLAHLAIYAMLTLLLCRTLRPPTENSWHWRSAFISILGSAVYAASDEFHQLFVPGRHGSVSDWCVDMMGAVLGVSVVYLWAWLFSAKGKRCPDRRESTEAK